MIDLSRALLVVRPIDTDTESPGYDGPTVPAGWSSHALGTTGWYAIHTDTGAQAVAYVANRALGRVICAVLGPIAALTEIAAAASLAMPAREAWRRRAEAGVLQYLRYWPTWRCQGFERDTNGDAVAFDGVRRLLDPGGQLPDYTVDSLPWNLAADGTLTTQALARYRVTSVDRPALDHTLAGLGCNQLFEDEEDPGA